MANDIRVLLAIGCNDYKYLGPLDMAERDAERVFQTLLRTDIGEYDPSRSILLLSPSLQEMRDGIRKALFSSEKIDAFTLFFAGHGGVKSGSFYMAAADSKLEFLSATALSLGEVFRNLGEALPQQSNIIIDACESGGLIEDLGSLLKPELMGDANTPGVTILAMAAKNQAAKENEIGGFGTNAVLDVIEGREFVQDRDAALDLVEIGRAVSSRVSATGNQSPVVWGLNLCGPPRFCKNPRYGADAAASLRGVLQSWPAEIDAAIRANYEKLWRVYASAGGAWDARQIAGGLEPIFQQLKSEPSALVSFADRLQATFVERAAQSKDAFRPAVMAATVSTCLLSYSDRAEVRQALERHQEAIADSIIRAGEVALARLQADKYDLLGGGALSELYFLPERLAKLLGWTAAAGSLCQSQDRKGKADANFAELLKFVLKHYGSSIAIMSDAQAPAWAVAFSRAIELDLIPQAEEVAGLLFNSLWDCDGEIARHDLPHEKVLGFLMARLNGERDLDGETTARPATITTVLMLVADLLGLDEIFDENLWRLDGENFTAYFNSKTTEWGLEMMEGGQYSTWGIGRDIFRAKALRASWPEGETATPPDRSVAAGIVIASLLYPDRVPWHVLTSIQALAPASTAAKSAQT